eukprot:5986334-Prorocentrum_lima.AAC.1
MTSSLVGSEMCIRDRLFRDLKADAPYPPRKLEACPTVRWLRQVPSEPSDCLLYTSDAADDM